MTPRTERFVFLSRTSRFSVTVVSPVLSLIFSFSLRMTIPDRGNQNGTSPALLSVPCARLFRQISFANRLRASGGVAWVIATAASTGITFDSPFMLVTAVNHWPSVFAPSICGLYWRVFLPIPARRSAFAQSTLQLRQVQNRLCWAVFRSSPSTCPTSMVRVPPQRQQRLSPGGGQAFAL